MKKEVDDMFFKKKKQDLPRSMNIFESHYRKMLEISKRYGIAQNSEFELIPAMFTVGFLGAEAAKIGPEEYTKNSLDRLTDMADFDLGELQERYRFYKQFLSEKQPLGDWYPGETEELCKNPVANIVVALGDILFNPKCLKDYDNTLPPIVEQRVMMAFSEEVMLPLMKEMLQLFEDIRTGK